MVSFWTLFVLAVVLGLSSGSGYAQVGVTHMSLDGNVAKADLIVRGKVDRVETLKSEGQFFWLEVTLNVEEVLKGKAPERLAFAIELVKGDERWEQFVESGQEQLWFLMESEFPRLGEDAEDAKMAAKYAFKPIDHWFQMRLGAEVPDEKSFTRVPPPILTMDFRLLTEPGKILVETRRIVTAEPEGRVGLYSFMIPRVVASRTGNAGDANAFVVPGDRRLEGLAHQLIAAPEEALPKAADWPARTPEEKIRNERWRKFSADELRAEGARALRGFQSEENIERLKALLDHPAKVGLAEVEETEFFVRRAAFEVLEEWGIPVKTPVLGEGRDARIPKGDDELRYWLENMLWYHGYGPREVASAIGLEGEGALDAAQERFKIYWNTKPKRTAEDPILVLPYPGGRHPRVGFLEGAIQPQRETKVSVFDPWNKESYVVVDVPEAIWSNLGLTYLAHTHVATLWTEQGVLLKKLEWNRREDGSLDMERRLPNGIEFGTRVVPGKDAVRMEMWLKNGTAEGLTDLRVQNCVLLKGAQGFERQTNENKIFRNPYVAVRNEEGTRWIITAWEGCERAWGNEKCPCLHSDPQFPDCAPGETQRLRGWLSFYEGEDIDAELARIEKTGWRK